MPEGWILGSLNCFIILNYHGQETLVGTNKEGVPQQKVGQLFSFLPTVEVSQGEFSQMEDCSSSLIASFN
jgi:hypothetical protein